jgi:hypothetical protein
MIYIWILSQRMISPNDNILYVFNRHFKFIAELRNSSILVESCEGSEVLLWDRRCIMRSNKGICISRISNNQNLDILVGDFLNCLPLGLENLCIFIKKIFSLHAWASWLSPNQNSNISLIESLLNISSWLDICKNREGTVSEFHYESVERGFCSRELKKLEYDFLIGSKHSALANHEA